MDAVTWFMTGVCLLCVISLAVVVGQRDGYKKAYKDLLSKSKTERLRANRENTALQFSLSCMTERAKEFETENELLKEAVKNKNKALAKAFAKKVEEFANADVSVL